MARKIKEEVIRISPNMFDDNPIMIGRNKSDMIWTKFNWGERNDLIWEYCPLTKLNEHLVGTTNDYFEMDKERDTVKNYTNDDVNDIIKFINNLNVTQVGICSMYSLFKYSTFIKQNLFVLSDRERNFVVNILSNEEYKKLIDQENNEKV